MVINKTNIHQLYAFLIFHKEKFIAFHKNSPEILEYLHKSVLEKKTISFNNEMENIISDFFVKNNFIFDENTPIFFTLNRDCIINSIRKDVLTFKYTNKINEEEIRQVIREEAIKQQYILNEDSPKFLKSNYDVILGSVSLQPYSIDFSIGTDSFSKEQQQSIIDEIVNTSYIISSVTPNFLKESLEVVLSSIKEDNESFKYSSLQTHPKVIKALVDSKYNFTAGILNNAKIGCLLEDDVLDNYFNHFGMFSAHSEEEKQKNIEFIKKLLSTNNLKIKTVNEMLNLIVEKSWNDYKNENSFLFVNVLGKILANLRTKEKESSVIYELLENIEKVLGDKFNDFDRVSIKYRKIYNSETENKIEELQKYQEVIAKLSKIYVAKAKESWKNERKNLLINKMKDCFKVNINNPNIYNKILYTLKKEKFYKLISNNDIDFEILFKDIINKYLNIYSKTEILDMIYASAKDSNNYNKNFKPSRYEEYCRLEKVQKLINRLNQGYILIDGPEVSNYKQFIKLDESQNKYICSNDVVFDKNEIEKIRKYEQRLIAFNNIKKEIIKFIKGISIEKQISLEEINRIIDTSELPFTDEYFVFDIETTLNKYQYSHISDFFDEMDEHNINLSDKEQYENFCKTFLNDGFFWFLVILDNCDYRRTNYDFFEKFVPIAKDLYSIKTLAKNINVDISKFDGLIATYKLNKIGSYKQIAILNSEVVSKLFKDSQFDGEEYQKKVFNNAINLACAMAMRNESTVPYINGEYKSYKYSMYDALDTNIFLAGIDTNACFKIGGIDNDFLHYCCLNKNGFVIKIADSDDEFIARASGFRAGNYVFVNQLRVIEDVYSAETCNRDEIVEVFYKACNDIVAISQNNKNEKEKIDYVFSTRSYELERVDGIGSKCEASLRSIVDGYPMNNHGKDWFKFIRTKNLRGSYVVNNGFGTDWDNYSLICVASSKEIQNKRFEKTDITKKDVPALYQRTRSDIIISSDLNEIEYLKITKIKAMYAYIKKKKFEGVFVPESSKVYIGDNWYIIVNEDSIVDKCVLKHDKEALKEYKEVLRELSLNIRKNKKKLILKK